MSWRRVKQRRGNYLDIQKETTIYLESSCDKAKDDHRPKLVNGGGTNVFAHLVTLRIFQIRRCPTRNRFICIVASFQLTRVLNCLIIPFETGCFLFFCFLCGFGVTSRTAIGRYRLGWILVGTSGSNVGEGDAFEGTAD